MKTLRIHGPILLLMMALAFIAFGSFIRTPLWDPGDAQILIEAHQLNQDPEAMFGHIGFYFSQPLLQLAFLAEYRLFGLDTTGYILVNLMVHAFNAFLVYMLVNMLFPRERMALLAAIMFVFGVGSYGKILMAIHQLEALSMASLHLLVLYFFIRNDFRHHGKIWSPLFMLGMFLFLLTGLTKTASFSLILTLIAYKAFFYKWRQGRAVLSMDILAFALVGILFYLAQNQWGFQNPSALVSSEGTQHFSLISFKNIFRYLNLMFFPLQQSPMLETANPLVIRIYELRTVIRIFLTLSIISYSFFGFVFGSKAIRFFLAWTYITLLPFTGQTHANVWLNLSHLYLTSLGFCVILAAGTVGTSNLLGRAGWKKVLPYLVPLAFVAASLLLAHQLNNNHKRMADLPRCVTLRGEVARACQETVSEKNEPGSGVP